MSDQDYQYRAGLAQQALHQAKQLHCALVTYLASDRSPKRIQAGLNKAVSYFQAAQFTSAVSGVGKETRAVAAELASLQRYVDHIVAQGSQIDVDLTPTTTLPLVAALTSRCTAVLKAQRAAELVAADYSPHADEHVALLRKNAKFASKLPDLAPKGFGFSRVPVVFTTDQGRNKHAGIGWMNTELADTLGFDVDLLDGYAVLNRQIVLGVDSRISKRRVVDLDTEEVTHSDKIIKERTLTYKGGVPTFKDKGRVATQRDFIDEYVQLLNKNTGVVHVLVSDKPYGYKGDSWFWLMPDRDLRRLGRAFPGGVVKLSHWGFAF